MVTHARQIFRPAGERHNEFALFALSGYYSHIGGPWQSPIPALRLYREGTHLRRVCVRDESAARWPFQ